jgi:hypothetical protein
MSAAPSPDARDCAARARAMVDHAFGLLDALLDSPAVKRAERVYDELLKQDPAAAEAFVERLKHAIAAARAAAEARRLIERVRRPPRTDSALALCSRST